MSKLVIVAIKDVATLSFAAPVAVPHVAVAVRSVQQEASSSDSQMGKYPAEFELWQVAEFDVETGEVTAKLERVAQVSALVRKDGAA